MFFLCYLADASKINVSTTKLVIFSKIILPFIFSASLDEYPVSQTGNQEITLESFTLPFLFSPPPSSLNSSTWICLEPLLPPHYQLRHSRPSHLIQATDYSFTNLIVVFLLAMSLLPHQIVNSRESLCSILSWNLSFQIIATISKFFNGFLSYRILSKLLCMAYKTPFDLTTCLFSYES